jgi:quinol monooxygenase YgiN
MITVLFYATVKEGNLQAFHDHVVRLTAITRAEDEGCLTYMFHQQQDNPREFMLYEQWRDEAALDAHVAHCQAVFGPPGPNGRLPLALLGLCDRIHTVRYQVVA